MAEVTMGNEAAVHRGALGSGGERHSTALELVRAAQAIDIEVANGVHGHSRAVVSGDKESISVAVNSEIVGDSGGDGLSLPREGVVSDGLEFVYEGERGGVLDSDIDVAASRDHEVVGRDHDALSEHHCSSGELTKEAIEVEVDRVTANIKGLDCTEGSLVGNLEVDVSVGAAEQSAGERVHLDVVRRIEIGVARRRNADDGSLLVADHNVAASRGNVKVSGSHRDASGANGNEIHVLHSSNVDVVARQKGGAEAVSLVTRNHGVSSREELGVVVAEQVDVAAGAHTHRVVD
mmetsp:Transcript_17734/g.68787  ORF Transcript_17734/g.68787 Transcript_17734/m.68787 type:complete len:292 (-) Transcript_17734:931-1806(-)